MTTVPLMNVLYCFVVELETYSFSKGPNHVRRLVEAKTREKLIRNDAEKWVLNPTNCIHFYYRGIYSSNHGRDGTIAALTGPECLPKS